ncbi:hypothetical protein CLOM_g14756 [Closterium sp. NIES-68]|nr:hypothetical protein CLOM_g14756 [Closterium sp. NIES-68]GJP83670.1 hypothetical protein CLOP_g13799 [Closterium sp. NIES-67]
MVNPRIVSVPLVIFVVVGACTASSHPHPASRSGPTTTSRTGSGERRSTAVSDDAVSWKSSIPHSKARQSHAKAEGRVAEPLVFSPADNEPSRSGLNVPHSSPKRFRTSGASMHQSAAATNNRAGNHLNGATPARPSGAQFHVASSRDVKINRPQPQGAAHHREGEPQPQPERASEPRFVGQRGSNSGGPWPRSHRQAKGGSGSGGNDDGVAQGGASFHHWQRGSTRNEHGGPVAFHKAAAWDVVTHRRNGADSRSSFEAPQNKRGSNGHGSPVASFHKAAAQDVVIHRSNGGDANRENRGAASHGVNVHPVGVNKGNGGTNRGGQPPREGQFTHAGDAIKPSYGGEFPWNKMFENKDGDSSSSRSSSDIASDCPDGGDGGSAADGSNSGGGDNSSGSTSGNMDIGAILEEHNRARQEVGVPDLAWDDSVAAAAAEWANNLASRGCPLEHGGAEGLGQNLYWSAPAGLTPEEDRMAVQSWVEEKVDWTYSPVPEGCAEGRMCGHYTQVVWRDTTHVGCASAQCPDGGGMWVCNYLPPGNFIGAPPF